MEENAINKEYFSDSDYLYNLNTSEDYEYIRVIINEYLESNKELKDFISSYDIWVSKAIRINALNEINTGVIEIEKDFLWYCWFELGSIHEDSLGSEGFDMNGLECEILELKIYFIELKLDKLLRLLNNEDDINQFEELRNKAVNLSPKNLLINGVKPNISERYKIANTVFNIYNTISELEKINYTEKHILLAHLMGCSQQTARELFNGTQVKRTPIREDLVNSYLDSLK